MIKVTEFSSSYLAQKCGNKNYMYACFVLRSIVPSWDSRHLVVFSSQLISSRSRCEAKIVGAICRECNGPGKVHFAPKAAFKSEMSLEMAARVGNRSLIVVAGQYAIVEASPCREMAKWLPFSLPCRGLSAMPSSHR